LLSLEDLKKTVCRLRTAKGSGGHAEQKAKVLALAQDLPRLWHASTTQAAIASECSACSSKISPSKSRMVQASNPACRWQGGACGDVIVDLPRPRAEAIRYPNRSLRAFAISPNMRSQIVAELNRCGEKSATGRRHTKHTISWIAGKYRIQLPSSSDQRK